MKLPKTLYVRIQREGDEEWLSPAETIKEHADISERREVGVYKLEKVVRVTTEVTTTEKR